MTDDEQPAPDTSLAHALARRLDLITATPGAVLKYDINGDGVLDAREWEVLRGVIEAQIVRERDGVEPDPADA